MEKQFEQKNIAALLANRQLSKATDSVVQHQEMMGRIKEAGWLTPKWTGAWGQYIKSSKITDYDLERLIRYAQAHAHLFDARGFVRNRLQDKDWHKYDLPKGN